MATDLGNQSTSAASNTSVGAISIAEGCAMSNLNDGERAIIAQAKGALLSVVSAGTNTITATYAPAIDAYVSGWLYPFKAGGTNAGAASFNANGLGAKSITVIVSSGTQALAGGEIVTGGFYILQYDGINMVLLNPTADEGSFTPAIAGAGTAGTQTYSTQVGRYVRRGNLVTIWFSIIMTAKDAATSGTISINGLPFTASTVTGLRMAVQLARWGGWDLGATTPVLTASIASANNSILLNQSGDNVAVATVTETTLTATAEIHGSATFRIN